MRRRAAPETGSILPLVVLSVLVALLLIAGTSTASAAFLAQRDLQAWCDGAALAAAGGSSDASLYADNGSGRQSENLGALAPLSADAAAVTLREYAAHAPPGGTGVRFSTHHDRITVVCTRRVDLPFGRLFGISEGLDRVATSSARVPWST